MFERYTEKTRRAIFFARYEASSFGSPWIESEHLLLGLLRESFAALRAFTSTTLSVEAIRRQVEERATIRERMSTSVDLPLSNECKRALSYAAEEAELLSHAHIGSEHLLLGLLREEGCFAAEILRANGMRVEAIRGQLRSAPQAGGKEQHPMSRRLSASADLSPETMRVMMHAVEEAERVAGRKIGPEHVLLGLMREERSLAMLREGGLRVEEVQQRLRRADGQPAKEKGAE